MTVPKGLFPDILEEIYNLIPDEHPKKKRISFMFLALTNELKKGTLDGTNIKSYLEDF